MQVQMEHRLLRPRPAVEDRAVIGVPQLLHDLLRYQERPTDELGIALA